MRPVLTTSVHDRWRKMRRAGHEGFNLRASEQYQPMQEREAGLTVLDIIAAPDAWDDRLKQCVSFLPCFLASAKTSH